MLIQHTIHRSRAKHMNEHVCLLEAHPYIMPRLFYSRENIYFRCDVMEWCVCVYEQKKWKLLNKRLFGENLFKNNININIHGFFVLFPCVGIPGKYKIKERKKENLTYMNIFLGAIYTHKEYVLKKWKSEYKS